MKQVRRKSLTGISPDCRLTRVFRQTVFLSELMSCVTWTHPSRNSVAAVPEPMLHHAMVPASLFLSRNQCMFLVILRFRDFTYIITLTL